MKACYSFFPPSLFLLCNLKAMTKDYRSNMCHHSAAILVPWLILDYLGAYGTWFPCDKTRSTVLMKSPWMLNIITSSRVYVSNACTTSQCLVLLQRRPCIESCFCVGTFIRILHSPLPLWFPAALLDGKLAQDITYGSNKHLVQIGLVQMAKSPRSSCAPSRKSVKESNKKRRSCFPVTPPS